MAAFGFVIGVGASTLFPRYHTKFRPRARAVLTWSTVLGMPLSHRQARWDFDELRSASLDPARRLWIEDADGDEHLVGRDVPAELVRMLDEELGPRA